MRSSKPDRPEGYLHPQLIAPVLEAGISRTGADELASMFGLLSDPTRVRILHALSLVHEACVYDLSVALEISQSALSHQLALLRSHRVVARRKDGRVVLYRLVPGPVRRALLAAAREAAR